MATATAPVAYEHAALTKEKALSHAPRAAFARRRAPRRRRRSRWTCRRNRKRRWNGRLSGRKRRGRWSGRRSRKRRWSGRWSGRKRRSRWSGRRSRWNGRILLVHLKQYEAEYFPQCSNTRQASHHRPTPSDAFVDFGFELIQPHSEALAEAPRRYRGGTLGLRARFPARAASSAFATPSPQKNARGRNGRSKQNNTSRTGYWSISGLIVAIRGLLLATGGL